MTRMIEIEKTTDAGGREIYLVPLGGEESKKASIEREDFEHLMDLGLSPTWRINKTGYVTACAYRAPSSHVLIGRLVVDAGAGESVAYVDGDALNLRRDNLGKIYGSGKYRDRDYLKPKDEKFKRWKVTEQKGEQLDYVE